MPRLNAEDLAARLLNRPITDARVRKLRRHLTNTTTRSLDASKVSDFFAALQKRGGPMAVNYVKTRLG